MQLNGPSPAFKTTVDILFGYAGRCARLIKRQLNDAGRPPSVCNVFSGESFEDDPSAPIHLQADLVASRPLPRSSPYTYSSYRQEYQDPP